MDESGPGFVHGGSQRYRDLETVRYFDRSCCLDLWRVQSAELYSVHSFGAADWATSHWSLEIGHQPAAAQAGANSAAGRVAKSQSEVSDALQTIADSLF